MKKHFQERGALKTFRKIIKTPIVITFSVLMVGVGLILGMYAAIQDNILRITIDHEMNLLSNVEALGGQTIDARLAEMKGYCVDNLVAIEMGLLPAEPEERAAFFQKLPLPEDGLNLAYWSEGTLVCQDDSFRAGLEALDIASVAQGGEAVIFNPYFDDRNHYILTVAAATKTNSGVFIVQYDGFCMSAWLNAMVPMMEFGTTYIVDSEGYNIAAAREEEREWITTRYNAQLYARQNPNTENVSIAHLEGLALAGERGIGSYEWDGGISYVAYGPLTEVPWGYYVGFYEWEITAYAQDVAAISGRSMGLLFLAFGTFMGCIMVLIFRSLTRAREYNQEIQQQRMEAENRSRQDPLTSVKNKRAWQEATMQLNREIEAGAASFAIAVCDINGLKQVNDTLGHEGGDLLIIRASRYICQAFSESTVYRIGGDEFTVILQGNDLRAWEDRIEDFYRALAQQPGAHTAGPAVSVALGISHYQPGDASCTEVFHRADQAMYQKKAAMKANLC